MFFGGHGSIVLVVIRLRHVDDLRDKRSLDYRENDEDSDAFPKSRLVVNVRNEIEEFFSDAPNSPTKPKRN